MGIGFLVISGLLCALAIGWFISVRAGTSERRPAPAPPPLHPELPVPEWVANLTTGELAELCLRLLSRMGYTMLSQEVEGGMAQVSAVDTAPVQAHRVLMRAYSREAGPLGPEPLRQAIDAARAEGVNKVIVVAVRGFTRDAERLAEDSPLEILDGIQLAELANVRMPELVAEEFRPRRPPPPPSNGGRHLPA